MCRQSLKAHSHWGASTATATLFSVVSVHTGGHQWQWQWQWQHTNTYVAVAVAAAKWVSNPFHDNIIAVAFDAPSSVNTPHWIPHNPFMTTKIRRCSCRCRCSV